MGALPPGSVAFGFLTPGALIGGRLVVVNPDDAWEGAIDGVLPEDAYVGVGGRGGLVFLMVEGPMPNPDHDFHPFDAPPPARPWRRRLQNLRKVLLWGGLFVLVILAIGYISSPDAPPMPDSSEAPSPPQTGDVRARAAEGAWNVTGGARDHLARSADADGKSYFPLISEWLDIAL
ncbi:hypothetical protein BS78_07G029300 [Paspalum vaginatum]|nr:hypothetical protein BS78_07G029300 [Paspalum vaginatum]